MDFVIGHPRSGTMFVSRLLETSRWGVSVHELLFHLDWDAVSIPSRYYAGEAGDSEVRALVERYRGRDPWVQVDSNWKCTWILPLLLEQFPEARVLHLLRDPRATIQSCCDLGYYQPLPEATDDPGRRRNHWLGWMPRIRCDGWDSLTPFERNCAFWVETQRLALGAQALGPRYRQVRIEDLADDATAAPLLAFFGLGPPVPEWLAALRASGRINVKAHEKRPSAWDEAAFERICGPTARLLHYL